LAILASANIRTVARDWVVRTDWRELDEVILPSLDEGLLRQGWGYEDDQDLNVIGQLVYEEGRNARKARAPRVAGKTAELDEIQA
jgi:hypothetical protein